MKKLIIYFCSVISILALSTRNTFAQADSIDVVLHKILSEKNDDARIGKLYDYFISIQEMDVQLNLQVATKLLQLSQKNNDKIAEALAISQIGYQSYTTGNNTKSLEYSLRALKMSEEIGEPALLAIINNRLAHNYTLDLNKRKEFYSTAFNEALKTTNYNIQYVTAGNVGNTYFRMKNYDSALVYIQRSDQLSEKATYKSFKAYNYIGFGNTYAVMKKPTLAIAYYNLAIQEAKKSKSPRWICDAYAALAKFYSDDMQSDSCIAYAKKAIATIEHTGFSNNAMNPAKLLTDMYRNRNNDSAMKYADMYRAANDSINNLRSIQQTQIMAFDEELRQQEVMAEKIKIQKQRKQNIQYILLAVGIVTFIILFFLLSRSIIVNEKWISFFGILGLLIVFEFINLLIHPFLERITHHNPMLMLLALVALASLLIPLHHRIEKWIKTKMTEKNKKIRLESAKKTIEELEKKN